MVPEIKSHKVELLIALLAVGFLLPFLVFLGIYLYTPEIVLFKDNLLHSILMFIVTFFSFYSAFFSYRFYVKKQTDSRIFFSSMALYAIGFSLLCHSLFPIFFRHMPSFEAIFDVTEHYGLFLGAILFAGVIFSFEKQRDALYKNRTKIFMTLAGGLLGGLIALILSPDVVKMLYGVVNYITGITGILFFILALFLSREFIKTQKIFLLYFIFGFAILTNSGIIPFFYREWNILWWYAHLVFPLGLTAIFVGIIKYKSGELSFGEFFGGIPFYRKIGTKLLAVILLTGFVPLIVFGLVSIISSRQSLEKEIHNKLQLLAEAKESQIYSYLDLLKSRTFDFSSDGVIRKSVKEITAGSSQAVNDLNHHLVNNKKPLDETLAGIFVTDLKGKIIAATDIEELGSDESSDDYFIEGQKKVFVSDLNKNEHFGVKNMFVVSAPLKDPESGELLGVIINVFYATGLQDIFSGKYQLSQGAKTALGGISKTTEIYMINKSKNMLVSPGRYDADKEDKNADNILVDILPVKKCLEEDKEIVDTYTNYAGKEVIGSSMCLRDRGWTLLAEADAKEAFTPISLLMFRFGMLTALFIFLTVFTAFLFAGNLVLPLRKLHEATEIISEGNLDYRVDIKTKDEVEQLASAFNQMADKLKESYMGIENKIKERTSELDQKVEELERFNRLTVGRELKMIELKKEIEKLKSEQSTKND